MKLLDYYRGMPVTLSTPMAPDEVKQRINRATGSAFMPLRSGVVGRASLRRISLSYHASALGFFGMAVLAGRISDDRGGSLLALRFGGRKFEIVGLIIYYFIFGYFVAVLSSPGAFRWSPDLDLPDKLLVFLSVLLFIFGPLIRIAFQLRTADLEREELIAFLKTNLRAQTRLDEPR